MAKFKIIKTGKREDGMFWSLVSKVEAGFQMTAMLSTEKAPDVAKGLEVPDVIVKHINWKL